MGENLRRTQSFPIALVMSSLLGPLAYAIDHGNLDEGRPRRLEDPYPIAKGEWALESGLGFTRERRLPDRGLLPVEILYGAALNLHLGVGTVLSTDPHSIEGPQKSGDLHLTGLYNFNQETLRTPALGLKLALDLPSGVDSSGADVELKGLLSKSAGRLGMHFNVARQFLNGVDRGERDSRYLFVGGATYPVGAPRHTRTTVMGDLFLEQAPRRGEERILGVEAGVRHQLTARTVVDAGIGSEVSGPADRSSLFLAVGVSIAF
jgi:hypothetical protein